MNSLLNTKTKLIDFALLVVRVGLGSMFILHGEGKMFGGPEVWEKLGTSMSVVGIEFAPIFWGFMAAFAEFGGGVLLILGLLTRPACLLLFITMVIATLKHLEVDESLISAVTDLIDPKTTLDLIKEASHAIEAACIFFALMLTGPGKISLDRKVFG